MNEGKNYLPSTEPPPRIEPAKSAKRPDLKGYFEKFKGATRRLTKRDWITYGIVIPAFFYAFWGGIALILIMVAQKDLPDPETLQTYKPAVTSKVFDRNDKLIYEFYEERRDPISLDSMPPTMVKAFVAVEDERFYQHWGLSLRDISRALIKNILSGHVVEGASSITQQLARNMFLTFESSIMRKVKEAVLAVKLEQMYSKDEILEMYLNQVNFGHGAYGVGAAAERYFDKHLSELNTSQLCFLAALPKGGPYHLPYDNPDLVRKRRDKFINVLCQSGGISEKERDEALAFKIELAARKLPPAEAPYFVEEVRRYLERKYGADFIYREGCYIYTTLDIDMQRAANKAVEDQCLQIEHEKDLKVLKADYDTVTFTDNSPAPKYLQAALVAINTHTGEVLSLVGGRDYRQSSFDRAVQARRQPGSSFKVFVYTAAIDNGFTPGDVEFDAPVMIRMGRSLYAPANWDRQFFGPMTLREALAQSRNLVSVRLTRYVGPEVVVEYAHKMGVTSPLKPVLSISLGAVEVTPIEMATSFATLANQGKRVEPVFIKRIVARDGKIIEEWFPQDGEQVLTPQTSFLIASMMTSVIDAGTARIIRNQGFRRVAGGKTGTTDDYTDAWFVGFTPDISCAVWVGFDKKQPIYRGAGGGSCAAPIWGKFMKAATDSMPESNFQMPKGIITRPICTVSGLLATSDCPEVRTEYFLEGTEPVVECVQHRLEKIRGGSREEFYVLDRRLSRIAIADTSGY